MENNILIQTETKISDKTQKVSTKTNEPKKESSFFDSIMKDIKKESQSSEKVKNDTEKTSDKSNLTKKAKLTTQKTEETTKGEKSTKIINKENKNPVNKMIDSLVDIVVEEKKNIKQKEILQDEDTETISKKEIVKDSKIVSVTTTEDIKSKKSTEPKIDKINVSIPNNIDDNIKNKENENSKIINNQAKEIKKATIDIKKDIETIVNDKPIDGKNIDKSKLKEHIKANLGIVTKVAKEIVVSLEKNNESKKIEIIIDKTSSISKHIEQIDKKTDKLIIETKHEKKIEIKQSINNNIDKIDTEVEDIKIIISTQGDKVIKNSTTVASTSKSKIQSMINNSNTGDNKSPVMANMFLNKQKLEKEKVSLEQISKAKTNIEQNKSLESIKKSSEILDLAIDSDDVTIEHKEEKGLKPQEENLKKEQNIGLSKNQFLNKMMLNNKIQQLDNNKQNISKDSVQVDKIKTDLSNDIASKVQEKVPEIQISVPTAVVETIQTKIIGAQQKVGSFMSDVARSMYLNYKPPVTAFKMNLNPANLGSISIVIRSNKVDKSIDVSMNMNNNNTLDSFVENKQALQSALQKQLGEGSAISLNFGMQNGNSEQSFGQAHQESQNQSKNENENITVSQNEEDTEVEQIKEHY